MASTPTSRNRFNRQGAGDNAGTWGGVLNAQVFDLVDEALDGLETISISGTVTLTSQNYAADQARNRILKFTGPGGTAIIPGVEKWYIVHNAGSGPVTVRTAGGGGAVFQPGQLSACYCDGANCLGFTYTGSSEFITKVVGPVATTGRASFNAPHGTSPSSPSNGDIWTTAAGGLLYTIDGLTYSPGVERIAAAAVTGVATIDLTLFKNFRAYEILLTHVSPSAVGQTLALRVSTNGGGIYRNGASDYLMSDGSLASFITLGTNFSTTGRGGMIHITIDSPRHVAYFKPIAIDAVFRAGNSGNVLNRIATVGEFVGSSAEITNIRIYSGAGTISAHYALYGRR